VSDLETAAKAAVDGVVRPVDVGDVDGRCFLNNSRAGLYPRLVVRLHYSVRQGELAVLAPVDAEG
jgi:diacylglycerol kinase family enzyme